MRYHIITVMISYISYMTSYMISYAAESYDMKDLAVLSSKAVTTSIEGIASCLGSSTVDLTFPLNAAEGPQLALTVVVGDQVAF